MPVVLNTSSLSTFHRTECLVVLQRLFPRERFLVPNGVIGEFSARFAPPAFFERTNLDTRQQKIAEAITGLSAGEREAIALAKETDSLLIVDDGKARKKAKEMGVKVVGCLGIIRQAYVDCHIFKEERDRFIREGSLVSYWPNEVVEDVLRSQKP